MRAAGAQRCRRIPPHLLAVRRWCRLECRLIINIDIGGGSLELSIGVDEEPEVALSLPFDAGRLTREWLPGRSAGAAAGGDAAGLAGHRAGRTPERRDAQGGQLPDLQVATSKHLPLAGATHRGGAVRRGTAGQEDTYSYRP